MNDRRSALAPFGLAILLLAPLATSAQDGVPLDAALIERLTAAKGQFNDDKSVFKVSIPRSDLTVTVDGIHVTPPMGLTAWAAFMRSGPTSMVMGDMVLLEDQVNPAMSAALDHGLEVTALHNHFLWDSPRVMFMHIGGMGELDSLAMAVGHVLQVVRSPASKRDPAHRPQIDPAKTTLDPHKIDAVLGHSGQLSSGVYKVTIGRTTRMHGHEVGNAMGVNTWAAFAGSDNSAVVDGDFAVLEIELQAVLKALRHGGIEIVAIHQHMAGEQPRMLFLHYWGLGSPEDLARTLRTALQNVASD